MLPTRHRRTAAAALAAGAVALAAGAAPARAGSDEAVTAWRIGPDGRRYRVAFDLGDRFVLGAVASFERGARGDHGSGLEMVALVRGGAASPDRDAFWKRDHEMLHLVLDRGDPGWRASGVLYRGLYLRHSREGSLIVPTSPPWRVSLPFDVGVMTEVGRFDATSVPIAPGDSPRFGVVHGEVLLDWLRSRRSGRYLVTGFGGRYDVGASRPAGDADVAWDHRITPMTALSLAARVESARGLAAAGARVEGQVRWSSRRGWEPTAAAEADAEWIPLALNDRPVSLFVSARAETGGGTPSPGLRVLAGLRLGFPLGR